MSEKSYFTNIIIGFGKGGKSLAKFLALRGEDVALIEKNKSMYGGTCINIGCIPTKSLVVNGQKGLAFEAAKEKKDTLIEKLNMKNYHMIADLEMAQIIDGQARFIDNHSIEILNDSGEVIKILEGDRIFINTGASAFVPPIPGLLENSDVLTSTSIMALNEKPEHLVIIGAGYIGLEFASMFVTYGTKVTILDVNKNFLPREDDDISQRIKADLEAAGVIFHLGVEINRVNGSHVEISDSDGLSKSITGDKILVATGRTPNTVALGLENTSIQLGERGEIIVNEKLETTAKNVWAIGDVHGGPQFTYISFDDFRILQSQLYGDQSRTTANRMVIPNSVFITPTFSSVGLTEKALKEKGRDYRLFKLEATAIPKSAIMSEQKGIYKVVVDSETEQILGATLYGEDSHEVINLISLAMNAGLSYTMLQNQIFTHPTMSEALNDLFSPANEVK